MKKWLIDYAGTPSPEVFYGLRGYDSPIVVDTLTRNAWYFHPERGVQKLKFKIQPSITEFPADKPSVIDVRYSEGVPIPEIFGSSRGRGSPITIDHSSNKAYYLSALSELKEVTGAVAFDTGVKFGDRYLIIVPGNRLIFTSQPYPIVYEESLNISHAILSAKFLSTFTEESIDVAHAVLSGILLQPLKTYSLWPDESVDVSHAVLSGTLVQILLNYSYWPDESVDVSHAVLSGTLVQILLNYSNWPDESVDVSHAILSGVLT